MKAPTSRRTPAALIYPFLKSKNEEGRPWAFEEALSLAGALDLEVVFSRMVPLEAFVSATLLGKGNLEQLLREKDETPFDLLVVNGTLSPVQQRNLERFLGVKVIDRVGLILEIFGKRARTREGLLQVEHAALAYQRSRLVRSWTHLERQRGGFGFLGGPGESQIELDRRMIDQRMEFIEKKLKEVVKTRGVQRYGRQRRHQKTVALVGYTNAGKSTLFNKLTRADVFVADQLFATLDPTFRKLTLPPHHFCLLSDTVGFISNLPHHLVAAFRATLEEVVAADLILHVQDVNHPFRARQEASVLEVLDSLGLGPAEREGKFWNVFNKADLGEGGLPPEAAEGYPAFLVSAHTGQGLQELKEALKDHFWPADIEAESKNP